MILFVDGNRGVLFIDRDEAPIAPVGDSIGNRARRPSSGIWIDNDMRRIDVKVGKLRSSYHRRY